MVGSKLYQRAIIVSLVVCCLVVGLIVRQRCTLNQLASDVEKLVIGVESVTLTKDSPNVTSFASRCNGTSCEEASFNVGLLRGLSALHLERSLDPSPIRNRHSTKMVTRILIVSTYRTGSSFLGDLIDSSPGVFYSYEPLHFLTFNQPTAASDPIELLQSIFDCRFNADYLQHMNKINRLTDHILEACRHDRSLCVRSDFVEELCSNYPIRLIKTVRLTLRQIVDGGLVRRDSLGVQWKVIYLVRDPRAILASRAALNLCRAEEEASCHDSKKLCDDFQKDIALMSTLRTLHPDRYYLLKYEDLVSDLAGETVKLFDFLGVAVTLSVRMFQWTHTRSNDTDPYSTYRSFNHSHPSAWRSQLSVDNVTYIEKNCAQVIQSLAYSPS